MATRAVALLGLAASAAAFMPATTPALASVARPAATSLRMSEGAEAPTRQRFNTMIDLASPKVATQVRRAGKQRGPGSPDRAWMAGANATRSPVMAWCR